MDFHGIELFLFSIIYADAIKLVRKCKIQEKALMEDKNDVRIGDPQFQKQIINEHIRFELGQ